MFTDRVPADDETKQIGWWKSTFARIDNAQMLEEHIYIAQSNGTFRCPPKGYTTAFVNPFVGYFSALEPLANDNYTIKYVYTGQGTDDEEIGEVENFPADEFDSDTDFDISSDIQGVEGVKQSDNWYDMQGRKLYNKPNKGVYIHNGQKVIIY